MATWDQIIFLVIVGVGIFCLALAWLLIFMEYLGDTWKRFSLWLYWQDRKNEENQERLIKEAKERKEKKNEKYINKKLL